MDAFYRKFYFRAGKIAEISAEMLRDADVMKRRLREGVEFVSFLRKRRQTVYEGPYSLSITSCLG